MYFYFTFRKHSIVQSQKIKFVSPTLPPIVCVKHDKKIYGERYEAHWIAQPVFWSGLPQSSNLTLFLQRTEKHVWSRQALEQAAQVESPSLEVLKKLVDVALWDMV